MRPRGTRPTRRCMLGAGAAALGAAWMASGGTTAACDPGVAAALRDLEREHGARLGVFGHNTVTGATVAHRADERFPLCSVHKPLAAAALLRDASRDGAALRRTVRYTDADLVGHSPVTGTPGRLAYGMTVEALCRAAVEAGDNTAGNLLLRRLGGPTAVTRFCRSLGDPVTRLDRWEPELNSAEPWRITDTTSPRGIARTFHRLTLGDALGAPGRRLLTGWLRHACGPGTPPRPGLPPGWTAAAKTGAGAFGTANDVGVVWTPRGVPVVLAVLTTKPRLPDARADKALVAATAALLTGALS